MIHWTIHLEGGPVTYYHVAVVVGHKLYSFGGCMYSKQLVHIFNMLSLCWEKLPPVTNGRGQSPFESPFRRYQRYGHTAVLVEEIVYMWGGGYPICNVLHAFDVNTHSWFKPDMSGTIPKGRVDQSACVLEKVIYVYGGRTSSTRFINDTHKLDTTIMVWSLINTRGTTPPGSFSHSATIIGTKMFVFGGSGDHQMDNSIRVFDTETNCWLSMPPGHLIPEGRWAHSAFSYNGELYVFGGENRSQLFNDLWKFIPETFSWKQVEPKGKDPCRMYGMCCCMLGDRIIIHGGHKENLQISGDLYILDLNPSLKMLCKLAVTQHGLGQSELPHNIRWELAAMTATEKKKVTETTMHARTHK